MISSGKFSTNNLPVVFCDRGIAWSDKGDYERAIADYNASLERAPKSASSLYVRELAKRQKGDQVSGDADIAAAKAIDPKISTAYAGYGVTPWR